MSLISTLCASEEKPEIIPLAMVLLPKHLFNARPLSCEFPEVWRVETAAEDLVEILVLFTR